MSRVDNVDEPHVGPLQTSREAVAARRAAAQYTAAPASGFQQLQPVARALVHREQVVVILLQALHAPVQRWPHDVHPRLCAPCSLRIRQLANLERPHIAQAVQLSGAPMHGHVPDEVVTSWPLLVRPWPLVVLRG